MPAAPSTIIDMAVIDMAVILIAFNVLMARVPAEDWVTDCTDCTD